MTKTGYTVVAFIILLIAGVSFSLKKDSKITAEPSVEKSIVTIDGSSTVFPITEAVAEEFKKVDSNINVVVGVSGTGGGFKRFCRGETVINDASRRIKSTEIELCAQNNINYLELPIAFDGIAVMVHPDNNWVDYLTVAELKKIWEPAAQNNVVTWNQVRPQWPDEPINLYGAGSDSGTYDYFTEAVVGEEGSSRGDFVASEDDNVLVQGISADQFALGFFGYAYYAESSDRLKLIPIVATESGTIDDAVLASPESINNGTYKPLSRPLFIYVSINALEEQAVSKFMEFYLDSNRLKQLVSEVGYIPFSEEVYEQVLNRFRSKTAGHNPDDALKELLR